MNNNENNIFAFDVPLLLGDSNAFENAKNYVSTALALWQQDETFHGYPWVKYDSFRKTAAHQNSSVLVSLP